MRATPRPRWAADERATPPVTSTQPGRAVAVTPVDKKPMSGTTSSRIPTFVLAQRCGRRSPRPWRLTLFDSLRQRPPVRRRVTALRVHPDRPFLTGLTRAGLHFSTALARGHSL